jgi:hypothetical protein
VTETAPAGASFYALGPEFEWLASAWDGFAQELAQVSSMLRHIVEAASADPQLAAESSGLAALESATDRLVRELVEDAARIRHTQTTYEQADAAVHAAVPALPTKPGMHSPHPAHAAHDSYTSFGTPLAAEPLALSGHESGPTTSVIPVFGGSTVTDATPAAAPRLTPAPGLPLALDGSGLWHANGAQHLSETALGTLSRFRRQILARAEHWVAQRVPYNQGAWHEGYRTDCAGYVSMCWGLRDSLVTSTMPQISHRIAKEDLRAGDVLLNTDVATGHVVVFDRWADYAHNSYVGYELCPQGTLHHVIPYPYYSGLGVYEPYRYTNAGD